jgi:hypothetical protein
MTVNGRRNARRKYADQDQDAKIHDRRRKRDAGIFCAALLLASEPLGERLRHGG